MFSDLDLLLISVAVLGLVAVLLPLAWSRSGHEYEDDKDLGHLRR